MEAYQIRSLRFGMGTEFPARYYQDRGVFMTPCLTLTHTLSVYTNRSGFAISSDDVVK